MRRLSWRNPAGSDRTDVRFEKNKGFELKAPCQINMAQLKRTESVQISSGPGLGGHLDPARFVHQ